MNSPPKSRGRRGVYLGVLLLLGILLLWSSPRQTTATTLSPTGDGPEAPAPETLEPAPTASITEPIAVPAPVDEALTSCSFQRDWLNGQVIRCAGASTPWDTLTVPPADEPNVVEARIEQVLTGTQVTLQRLDCSEYPCMATLRTTTENKAELKEAWSQVLEGYKSLGFTSREGDQVVHRTCAVHSLLPDEGSNARLSFRLRQQNANALRAPPARRQEISLDDPLDTCYAELDRLNHELIVCEGKPVEWPSDDVTAIGEDEVVGALSSSDVFLQARCEEYPCIAVFSAMEEDALDEVMAPLVGEIPGGHRQLVGVAGSSYWLVAVTQTSLEAAVLDRFRSRSTEIMAEILDDALVEPPDR